MIGLYGIPPLGVIFQSGTGNITTFDDLRKTTRARWGVHEIFQGKPQLEYAGAELIELSFSMNFIKPMTTDPTAAMFILEEMMDLAIPGPFVVGLKPMGRGMSLFVMEELEENPKYFFQGGGIIGASVQVKLKEYPDNFLNTLLGALGGLGGFNPANFNPDVVAPEVPELVNNEAAAALPAVKPITSVAIASRL